MVHLGKGSGRLPVAAALLNDVLGLYHPSHSWTGRFPRGQSAPRAPKFARFLTREGGASVLRDECQEGAIPLLEALIWPHVRRQWHAAAKAPVCPCNSVKLRVR